MGCPHQTDPTPEQLRDIPVKTIWGVIDRNLINNTWAMGSEQ